MANLTIFAGLAGCSTNPAVVILKPQDDLSSSFSIAFPRAFYGKSAGGEDEIVLLHDPIDDQSKASANGSLRSITAPALRQALVILMHWRTAPADNADSPVADNAVVHWYIYADPENSVSGVLHYIGPGSVSFSASGVNCEVNIRKARLSLAEQRGNLIDPFHAFGLTGAFSAHSDPVRLQRALTVIANATPSLISDPTISQSHSR